MVYRDYLYMWGASLSAGAAAWALIVGRGWLIYEMTDSALLIGVVTFAAMIPRVAITPFTGYLSDRFERKAVLALMFGASATQNLVLAALVAFGWIEVWHLIALSFVDGSARAAQMPAGQALLPNLVPRSLILNAIALNQAAVNGSRMLGPAAIAPLLTITDGVNAGSAFFVCSGFYAASVFLTLRIKTVSTGKIDPSLGFTRNILEGLVYVYRTPSLRAIMLLALFHCGLTMSFESLLPIISHEQFRAEGAGFSYLMVGIGAGAIVTAIAMARIRSETTKGRLFLHLGVLSGVTPALLAISPNMPIAVLAAATMGATQAGFMTLTHTMIQSITVDGIRGRVGGVYSVHIGGTMATANLINGGLADIFNTPILLLLGGASFIVVMFLSWQMVTLRSIYMSGLNLSRETTTR